MDIHISTISIEMNNMQIQELLQQRKQRGYAIAQTRKVINQNGVWIVPSATKPSQTYKVQLSLEGAKCNCPDFAERGLRCKHIFAVDITVSKQFNKDGTTTITQTKKITYPQNWTAYNKAQINEKELFMKLLADLCKGIEEPIYTFGRPRLQLKDMVFSSALKVYSTVSLRRFMSDAKTALEKGYITKRGSATAVGKYIQNERLTPILNQLITASALPLKAVETKFAIDSSGFRTTKFNDYCRETHHTDKAHQWIKVHVCTGVKTNIITAVEVGLSGHWKDNDHSHFIPLAEKTHELGFNMQEISADKAYSSKANLECVVGIGATPYIPFRSNASADSVHATMLWKKMYNFFVFNQEQFLEHYHSRSNVESTFNMIKAKFTDLVRSKDNVAQLNEVLLKILCHNIVVLIQETFELGIEPNFYMGA